jgi:hypothetical protein
MSTKRSARRFPRVFYAVALASALVMTGAGPVQAATSSFFSNVPAYPIKSNCVGRTNNDGALISWRGGEEWYSSYWDPRITSPHGAMYFCYATYRLGPKTADGDWYAVDLRTVWRPQDITWDWQPAFERQIISSNKTAKDYQFDGTPDYTSNQSCDSSVSVGFSVGLFSVGTSMNVCSGEKVDRSSLSWTGASWAVDSVHRAKLVETAYVQKVAHGVVPTFTLTVRVPYYTYEYVGWPTYWEVTPKWDEYRVIVTGTV